MLIDGLKWCELLWCFYQLFGLLFWRHPFTADNPLVNKWFDDFAMERNTLLLLNGSMMKLHPDRTWPLSMNASGHDCARTMRALALFTLNLDTMFTLTPVLCVQQASFLVSVYVDKHAEGLSASSGNHSALNYIFVCTSHKHLLKSVDIITYTINPKCDKSIWQELFNVVKQIQKIYLMHMQKLFNYSRFTVMSYIFSDSMEVDFTYTT